MTTIYSQHPDAESTAANWEQYEKIRLDRIREQRIRMENMKDAVCQYARIIGDLEARIKVLEHENEELRARHSSGREEEDDLLYDPLRDQYERVCLQLDQERKLRINNENIVQMLKRELDEVNIERSELLRKVGSRMSADTDFEVLQGLYQQLKDQLYHVHKENLSLKEVIREQSKFAYERDATWKGAQKQNKPGMIRVSAIGNTNPDRLSPEKPPHHQKRLSIPFELSNPQLESKITLNLSTSQPEGGTSLNHIKNSPNKGKANSTVKISEEGSEAYSSDHPKIRAFKQQIKKLNLLVDKFKHNEEQQFKLIEILKSQRSKICACHTHGKSSKKIIGSKGIMSFKNN